MQTPGFETILLETRGPAAWITFNRPRVHNAMNITLIREAREAIRWASEQQGVRCLVFAGAGDRAFTAGADINELRDMTQEGVLAYNRNWLDLFRDVERCRKPVIAAVHGWATGGGTELSLACDFVICTENARFGLTEINIGVIPGAGAVVRLTRWVGRLKAKEIVMLGRHIEGGEAVALQLANRCVADSGLHAEVDALVEQLAQKPPLGLAAAKASINIGADVAFDAGLEYELQEFVRLFGTEDQREGMAAFFEKRPASFQGR
jgi:enoyl-CoA hydratase/carnithine racemase